MNKYMGGVAYPREVTHTVEVSLQWGEFTGVLVIQIKGNAMGVSVINSVLEALDWGDFEPDMQFEQNQKHIELVESGDDAYVGCVKYYKLYNGSGDELQIDYDDITDCVIGVQIVDWEASG